MTKQFEKQSTSKDVILIGKTTLRHMVNAAYDKNDPFHDRITYSECGRANMRIDITPSMGDEIVYVYYHLKEDTSIMTNMKDDVWGVMGSSAGFKGKIILEKQINNKGNA